MKTEQEQIGQIEKVLKDSVMDYKHLKKKGVCYCYAETLIDNGYGNISEYKAEREMLGSQIKVLKQRLNDKYIEVDNLNRDYRNVFERLKSQGREIAKLKEENKKDFDNFVKVNDELLKANMKLSVDKKQAQIDVLNKLKEKYGFYSCYSWHCDTKSLSEIIDEFIEEVENDK